MWKLIEEFIFPVPSTNTLFNPNPDWDASHDRPDADRISPEKLGLRARGAELLQGVTPAASVI